MAVSVVPETVAAPTPDAGGVPASVPAPSASPSSVPAQPIAATTPAAASATGAPPADAAAAVANGTATAAQVAEIEGWLNGQPHKVPADLEIPWKDGDKTGRAKLADMATAYQRVSAADRRFQEAAAMKQEVARRDREIATRDAELKARLDIQQQDRKRLYEAYRQGGEALQRELEHQQRLEQDPEYRTRYEESNEFRVSQHMAEFDSQVSAREQTAAIVEDATNYITEACGKVPGLDPNVVIELYANAITQGKADFTPASVDRIIASERARMERVQAPLKTEIDAMRQELADVRAALAAQASVDSHNSRTTAAVNRSVRPTPGKPVNGNPPAATTGRKPFNPETDDSSEWLRNWRNGG